MLDRRDTDMNIANGRNHYFNSDYLSDPDEEKWKWINPRHVVILSKHALFNEIKIKLAYSAKCFQEMLTFS